MRKKIMGKNNSFIYIKYTKSLIFDLNEPITNF